MTTVLFLVAGQQLTLHLQEISGLSWYKETGQGRQKETELAGETSTKNHVGRKYSAGQFCRPK